MNTRKLPDTLSKKEEFSRQEYMAAMADSYVMNDEQISYDLRNRLKRGEIVRKGWGQYATASEKQFYHFPYSKLSNHIAGILSDEFCDLQFRIFEYVQLNDFMNHLAGHNTIFISVENELMDYVFEKLFEIYPGKVMLKPKLNDYFRYHQDEEIVILRLPSESPKGTDKVWHIRIEQMLDDVLVDKLISRVVPETEKANIVNGAFDKYLVDENTMIRYSKRKGAENKLKNALKEYRKETTI